MLPAHRDWLKKLTFARDKIDWADPNLDQISISRSLLGDFSYWKHPDFNVNGIQLEPFQVELKILRDGKRDNWHKTSPYGKEYFQHFLTLGRIIMPEVSIHPNTHDICMVFCHALARGCKGVHLVGSQNSGKSNSTAFIGMTLMAIDPKMSTIKVASPVDKSADNTLFGDFRVAYDIHVRAMSIGNAEDTITTKVFKDTFAYKQQFIRLADDPKMGKIEQLSIKNIGLHKGTKINDAKRQRGVIMHAIDEINEHLNAESSYLTILSNVMSQEGFICLSGQNFTGQDNLGGILCKPVCVYEGNPDGYKELTDQGHQQNKVYHSYLDSVTLRLSGYDSPNVLAGRIIYPYLLTQKNIDTVRQFGEDSPQFYSQILAFPVGGEDDARVLTKNTLDNSRYLDQHYTFTKIKGTKAHCDPSFSIDGDQAMWSAARYGEAMVVQGDGTVTKEELIEFFSMERLAIKAGQVFDEYWASKCRNIGLDMRHFITGSNVSGEMQVAIQCAELNSKHGIKAADFSYDPSLRADCVTAFTQIIGRSCKSIDYRAKPSTMFLPSFNRNTEDFCFNVADQAAFALADCFATKCIRGGEFVLAGAIQLTRTKYDIRASKFRLEDKHLTKKRLACSPDARDTIAGVVLNARISGFSPAGVQQAAPKTQTSDIYKAIKNKFSMPTYKKLKY